MRYHVTVRSDLSDRIAGRFAPVATERLGGETRLTVDIRDQAEMVGVLDRLGDLGIELIAIVPADAGIRIRPGSNDAT